MTRLLLPFSGRTPSCKRRNPYPWEPKTQGPDLSVPKKFLVVPKLLKGSDSLFFSPDSLTLPFPGAREAWLRFPVGGVGPKVRKRPIPPVCWRASSSNSREAEVPRLTPTEPPRPAPGGKTRARNDSHSGKRPRLPPSTARRPDPDAAAPGQRGRCPRHYLPSPRWAWRARCLRGGREMPGWPGAPRGGRCSNPTLYLLGLKRPSASLLLSPSPNTERPPARPCYGERRGPIPRH